jgi:hypothetical protein
MEHYHYHINSYDRIRKHSAPYVNERIDREAEGNLFYYSQLDDHAIIKRITELDYEWDIDRSLMALFSVVGGTTFTLGLTKNKRMFFLLGAQMSFLLLHAIQGWCPPASLLRRLGFRSKTEIESEKYPLLNILESRLHEKEPLRAV